MDYLLGVAQGPAFVGDQPFVSLCEFRREQTIEMMFEMNRIRRPLCSATPPPSVEHCGQSAADDFAQGQTSPRAIEPQLADLRSGQLDGEGDLGRADGKGMAEALGLFQIAIGLASGDRACLCEPLRRL